MDSESESIGRGAGKLEGEVGGKGLDVDRRGPESAARFIVAAVSQLKEIAGAHLAFAVQLQTCGAGETARKIDAGGSTGLNHVRRTATALWVSPGAIASASSVLLALTVTAAL